MRDSDRDRLEPEEAEVTPQLSADPAMADSEAGNTSTPSAQDGATKVNSNVLLVANKKVTEYNKNFRPYADLIKTEKGDNKVKELERVKHLKDNVIKRIIEYIGVQRKKVEDEHKRFTDDKEARKERDTVAKTQLKDKKRDDELTERIHG